MLQWGLVVLFSFLISACSSGFKSLTATSTSTDLPQSETAPIPTPASTPNSAPSPTPTPSSSPATGVSFGANLHQYQDYGNGSASAIDKQFQLMHDRNLMVARVGGYATSTSDVTTTQNWIASAKKYNMHLIFMLSIEGGLNTGDGVTFISNDFTTLYNKSYNLAYNFILPFRNDITDWELGNEIDLSAGQSASPGSWNAGWTAADWQNVSANGSNDYFANWAAVVKGAADAIGDINSKYGTHMRRVLNVTSTHLGFLNYMTSKGVNYEVISYHYYQYQGTDPTQLAAVQPGTNANSWNLFAGLAAYNLPVVVDEFNCAEIYNPKFQNSATDALYATCLSNLRVQIPAFVNNGALKIEAIVPYELLDEPSNTAPENHFGLFWNDGQGNYTPKANLFLWSAFAGGALSSSETATLNSFNLLPLP